MSKKVKVLISVLVAVLLTVGGTATVLAQNDETTPIPEPGTKTLMVTANATGLLARVAGILGTSQEELVNAFKQVKQDAQQQFSTKVLDKLLEKGLINEVEAAAIQDWLAAKPEPSDEEAMRQWLEQRPEISKPGLLRYVLQGSPRFRGRRHGIGGQLPELRPLIGKVAEILEIPEEDLINALRQAQQEIGQEMREGAFITALERAVVDERITQEEADQIEAWWQQRPEAFGRAFPGANVFPARHGRRMMAAPNGWSGMKLHKF